MTSHAKLFLVVCLATGGCVAGPVGEDEKATDNNEPDTASIEQDVTLAVVDVTNFGGNLFAQDHPYTTVPGCDPGFIHSLAIPTTQWSSALGGFCVFQHWLTPDNPNDCRAVMFAHTNGGFSGATCTTTITEVTGGSMRYTAVNTSSATVNTPVRSIFLSAGQVVTVGTCGVPGESFNGDTYLRLNGPSGGQVAVSDDACGGLGSQLTYIVQTSGNYTVQAGCFSSSQCSATLTWTIN